MLDKLREFFGKDAEVVVYKSEEAQRLLANPLVQDFFREYPLEIQRLMFATAPDDAERREELYRLHLTFKKFERHFDNFITAGKILASEQPMPGNGQTYSDAGLRARKDGRNGR